MTRKALGKGFEALLPQLTSKEEADRITSLSLDRIDPNPSQPRHVFDQQQLEELAASIKTSGVLQPIVVKQEGDRYIVVVGERRLRASRLAGLETIPALVRDVTDEEMLHWALIENLQREDLDAIDQAQAFHDYMSRYNLTQEELATTVGKDRSAIANTLRLLNLPLPVQNYIREGLLSPGHARGLLGLDDPEQQENLAEQIIQEAWTVRKTEDVVRQRKTPSKNKKKKPNSNLSVSDPHISAGRERLVRYLGTKVSFDCHRRGGSIVISWFDEDDLDRLIDLITGSGR